MAEEETIVVELNDSFYRDRFRKVMFLFFCLVLAIILLAMTSIYLVVTTPPTQYFRVGEEWRIQPTVPINEAYLSNPDILQWTSDVLQKVFTLDFIHYQDEMDSYKKYFTPNGWDVFTKQINNYVNYDTVMTNMLFSVAVPDAAPTITEMGLTSGRYTWQISLPVKLTFKGVGSVPDKRLSLIVTVVRVPTIDNSDGVAIDNVILDTKANSNVL